MMTAPEKRRGGCKRLLCVVSTCAGQMLQNKMQAVQGDTTRTFKRKRAASTKLIKRPKQIK